MLQTYSKPMVLNCGNSSEIIKGQCGWGTENITLDKTGAKKGSYSRRKYSAPYLCPGPGVVNTCRVCRVTTVNCSTDSHDC